MTKLNDVIIACVFTVSASVSSADCDSGSTHEQLICLQREICPNPASEAERIACYGMITTALSGKEVPAVPDESIESSPARTRAPVTMIREPATATVEEPAAEVAVSNESIESSPAASGAAIEVIDEPGSVVVEPAAESDDIAESSEAEPARERRFSFSNLFGKDDEVEDPDWLKVVFVRTEIRGNELIVLDNAEVWVESERNPFSQFKVRDRVRISPTDQLIRKDGAKVRVSRVECGPSRPLKGRCRSLERYLD